MSAALSAAAAGLMVLAHRRDVAAGADRTDSRVRLERALARSAVDLLFAWRLARLTRRAG